MKRLRIILAAVFAASALTMAAPPASAYTCPPDEQMRCECAERINQIWTKLTGKPLVYCQM